MPVASNAASDDGGEDVDICARPGASSASTAIAVASASSSPVVVAPSTGRTTTTPVTSESRPPSRGRGQRDQQSTPVVPPTTSSSSSSASCFSSSSRSGATFYSAGSSFSPALVMAPGGGGVAGGLRLSFGSAGIGPAGGSGGGDDDASDGGNDDDDGKDEGGDNDRRPRQPLDSPRDVGGVVRRLIRHHGDGDGFEVGVGGGAPSPTSTSAANDRGDDGDDVSDAASMGGGDGDSGEDYGGAGSDEDGGDDAGMVTGEGDDGDCGDDDDSTNSKKSALASLVETNVKGDADAGVTEKMDEAGEEAFFTPNKDAESPSPPPRPPAGLPENGEEGSSSSKSENRPAAAAGTDADDKATPRQGGGGGGGGGESELDEEELQIFVSSPASRDLGQYDFAFLWRALKRCGWKYSAAKDTYHAPPPPTPIEQPRPDGDGDGGVTKKKNGATRGEAIGNSAEVVKFLDDALTNPSRNPRATELRNKVLREMCKLGKKEEEARVRREQARKQREAQQREQQKGDGRSDSEIDEEELGLFLSSPAAKDFSRYDFYFLWRALQKCGWKYSKANAIYYAPPLPVEQNSCEDGSGGGDVTKKKKGAGRGEAIGSGVDVVKFLDDAARKRGRNPRAAELRDKVLKEMCKLGKKEEEARLKKEQAREPKAAKKKKQQKRKTGGGYSLVGTVSARRTAGGRKNNGPSAAVQTESVHCGEVKGGASFGRGKGGRGSKMREAEEESPMNEEGDLEDEIEAFLVEADFTTIPFLNLWRVLSDELGWTHSGSTYYAPPAPTPPRGGDGGAGENDVDDDNPTSTVLYDECDDGDAGKRTNKRTTGRGEEIGSDKEVVAFLDGRHGEIVGLSARFAAGTASASPEEMQRRARAMRREVLRRYYIAHRGEIRKAWGAKMNIIGGGIGRQQVIADGEDDDDGDDEEVGGVLSQNSVHGGAGSSERKRPLRSATAIEDGAEGYLRKKRPAVGYGAPRRTTRPHGNKAGATKSDDCTESGLMHGDDAATASGGRVGEGRGGPLPQHPPLRWPGPQACVAAVLSGAVCAIHRQVGQGTAAERPEGDDEAVCTCGEAYAAARERSQRRKFGKWRFLLGTGHSLMLYGFGSKKNLLDDFCKEELLAKEERGTRVIKIRGYRREANISSFLDVLVHTLLGGHEPMIESNCAFEGFCLGQDDSDEVGKPALPISHGVIKRAVVISRTIAASRTLPVFIVVHNIDGPGLRNHVAQVTFASLVANSVVDGTNLIRLVASVDHVDAAASLWDTTTNANFAWIWQEVTTYRRYYDEIRLGMEDPTRSIRSREQKRTTAQKDSSGILNVLASLAPRHVETVKLLAKIQSETPIGTTHAVEFKKFFAQCRKEIFLRSDRDLRSYLGELRDHGIAEMETGPDGREHVLIPHSREVLKTITDYVVKK